MLGGIAVLKNADAEVTDAKCPMRRKQRRERRWAARDWRNAAEQGWQAVQDATAALLLEVNGQPPTPIGLYDRTVNGISVAISKLARERGGEWARLDIRFTEAMIYLHDQAYDVGTCTMTKSATWYARCGGLHPLRRGAGRAAVTRGCICYYNLRPVYDVPEVNSAE